MASPAVGHQNLPQTTKRRPFATWVRKLASRKSDTSGPKKKVTTGKGKHGEGEKVKNHPYPESGHLRAQPAAAASLFSATSRGNSSSVASGSINERNNERTYSRSNAPTLETRTDTIRSDAEQSRTFTTKTGGGVSSMDGMAVNSTFSSPSHSEHSLTTTLTTIRSTSPGVATGSPLGTSHSAGGNNNFSHQFPPGAPVSAIPAYLVSSGHPTYNSATANGLLTDDASILTLASSSKRQRRRSIDTDASVRALAPSSVWGGSRESLPLSVLSANTDTQPASNQMPPGPVRGTSVYSGHGVAAPALVSDRNSYYATSVKQSIRDKDTRSIDGRSTHREGDDQKSVHGKAYESSIKSGALGHYRNDSNAGSSIGPALSAGPDQHIE